MIDFFLTCDLPATLSRLDHTVARDVDGQPVWFCRAPNKMIFDIIKAQCGTNIFDDPEMLPIHLKTGDGKPCHAFAGGWQDERKDEENKEK